MTFERPLEPFLPYGRQVIEDDDLEAVRTALLSPYLTTGPLVAQFEAALASITEAREAVACANGTAALHLAARAVNLEPGQAAIVPSITFVATANAVRYCGAEVVFADVDPKTGLLTPATLLEALRRSPNTTRAVFPVHLNGQSCDMAGIAEIAKKWGLWVIEDACHAIGGAQADEASLTPVGSGAYSDLTCFSFHPVKNATTGEGGAITTNSAELAKTMRRDRSHGLTRDPQEFTSSDALDDTGAANPWFYELHGLGFNYRIPDILCALGISQLKKLQRFIAQRHRLVELYQEAIQPLAPLVSTVPTLPTGNPAWHLFVVHVDFDKAAIDRAELMRRLAKAGIGTQVHYIPVHRQPYYARRYPQTYLPGADSYYASCLSLPLFASMVEQDVARVAHALGRALDL